MLHKPANKQLTVQWIYKQGGKDKKSYPKATLKLQVEAGQLEKKMSDMFVTLWLKQAAVTGC